MRPKKMFSIGDNVSIISGNSAGDFGEIINIEWAPNWENVNSGGHWVYFVSKYIIGVAIPIQVLCTENQIKRKINSMEYIGD